MWWLVQDKGQYTQKCKMECNVQNIILKLVRDTAREDMGEGVEFAVAGRNPGAVEFEVQVDERFSLSQPFVFALQQGVRESDFDRAASQGVWQELVGRDLEGVDASAPPGTHGGLDGSDGSIEGSVDGCSVHGGQLGTALATKTDGVDDSLVVIKERWVRRDQPRPAFIGMAERPAGFSVIGNGLRVAASVGRADNGLRREEGTRGQEDDKRGAGREELTKLGPNKQPIVAQKGSLLGR
ncbi:hypothetical protein FB451DRAFT_1179384 [Mycena latifolia]|nr:hypothetical protein FB451DRAFT_1179384 [Mycena latifolia]